MKRYLDLIQTLYTVNHNSGIESYFNATSIYDHDFAPLPFPTVDEFLTVTHFSIDFNWIISTLKLILMYQMCHFDNSYIS